MENLRTQIELDLRETLEGEFKMNVELTSPDGVTQTLSKNDPTQLLSGQVFYFSRPLNPETGEEVVVNQPVVSLRISSLNRVPLNGETWYIKIPVSPVEGAAKESFVFTATRPYESGTDIGFMRIYPQRVEAESGPEVMDDEISYS